MPFKFTNNRRYGGEGLAPDTGGGADRWANGPAWSGYHWEFVYEDGSLVTRNVEPVVTQVRN